MSRAYPASVVIPTHHGAHRLPVLLDGLAAQDSDLAIQVVVVFDGILDETPALLDEWAGRLTLKTVTHESARGVAAALTSGFNAADGEYLIRCDDDLTVPRGFIDAHLRTQAGSTNRVVISLTRDAFPDSAYARAYGRPANERGLLACYEQDPEDRWQHVAACFSLHRSLWCVSGGFDPAFAYGEDSEFGYRLWRDGAELVIASGAEVVHRGPATTATTRIPRSFVSGASQRLFAEVHPDAVRRGHPGVESWKSHTWNAAVRLLANVARTHTAYRRIGRLAQWLVDRLPSRVGGKVVALGVEAAHLSGRRHGSTNLHAYRPQKDAEVAAELAGRSDGG